MLQADIKKKNKKSKLCLDYAVESNCQEIQDFFHDYNYMVNQKEFNL